MKRLLFCASIVISGIVSSQTPRIILYEEFSGENCGPCASANPGIHQLLHSPGNYGDKIVAVKYQVPIPTGNNLSSNSPYLQNSSESNSRASFYSVPFAPYARFNGIELPHPQNANNDGLASLITQTYINDSSGTGNPSPFSLSVTHYLNAALDSIFITCTFTASQSYTANGFLKLNVVLEEEEIHLQAPTGSNGEKDFYNVMRKMIPNQNGTLIGSIGSSWTNGQTQTKTFKVKIPSYIFDKNELSVVAFLQTTGDKRVHQAAWSSPQTILGVASADISVSSVVAYPNPTSNNAVVHVGLVKENESILLSVHNNLGALVYTETKNNIPATGCDFYLNTEQLAAGVYHITVSSSKNTLAQRLVVEK